jgi:hypothetical protein
VIKKVSENNVSGQEGEVEINPIKEIFTLENAIKFYKKFSDNNPYKCSWVSGLEGELIQFIYKSGNALVVERIHVDDLEDAKDWDHIGYQHGTEMIFSMGDLKDLTKFMEGK